MEAVVESIVNSRATKVTIINNLIRFIVAEAESFVELDTLEGPDISESGLATVFDSCRVGHPTGSDLTCGAHLLLSHGLSKRSSHFYNSFKLMLGIPSRQSPSSLTSLLASLINSYHPTALLQLLRAQRSKA